MKVLSLKLKDEIFKEVEKTVRREGISRNAYINQALLFYNKINDRKHLRRKLQIESKAVATVSLEVLKEFESLEDDLIK